MNCSVISRNGLPVFALVLALPLLAVYPAAAQVPAELAVGVKAAPPFALKNENGDWSGLSIELWERVARELQLKFHYAEEETVQGLLDGTEGGKYDIGLGAITVTAEREQRIDFTQAFYVTGLGIAVPAVSAMSWVPIARAMTSFGFLQAVIGLLALALLAGLLMWLFERRHNEEFGGDLRRGLTSSVWWSTLAMTQRTRADTGPKTMAGRVVGIVWMIASIIAIAVFTAGITSLLTTKQLQGLVHNVSDLSTVRVGTVSGTAAVGALAKMHIKNRGYVTAAQGLSALQGGKIDAFVFDRPLLAWTIRQRYSSALQLLDVTFESQNYAFPLPNGSALRKPINIALLKTIQSEWWKDAEFRYLGAK
jgi:ABC-type amino acid transport substrate-binding protein